MRGSNVNCFDPVTLISYLRDPVRASPLCLEVLGAVYGDSGVTIGEYLSAFFLTLVFETPAYLLVFYTKQRWAGGALLPQRPWRYFMMILTINLCTHPLVVFGLPELFGAVHRPIAEAILWGEVLAPSVEALLLVAAFAVPWRRALAGALLANLISWFGSYLL